MADLLRGQRVPLAFGGGDRSTVVFIPFSTARFIMNPDGWINLCWGQLASPEKAEDAKAEIRFVLRTMRKQPPEEEDTFIVQVLQQFIDQFKAVAAAITAFAGGIVGISLLVGGIGIMNIMLVSVTERTREIGVRMAVGATGLDILFQFLFEALIISALGGGFGLLLGCMLADIIDKVLQGMIKTEITIFVVGIALTVTMVVGLVSGIYPAWKASRQSPVDALRYE